MTGRIDLGEITVDVVFKNIKNVHLSVHPPDGQVRIAAPSRLSLDTLRVFAISKLDWIKRQQRRMREQERETPREFLDRESHYLWGRRYLLNVIEADEAPSIVTSHNHLQLRVRPGSPPEKMESVMAQWYRAQIKEAAQSIIEAWAKVMGVAPTHVYVQRMKTRWGSCNPRSRAIRLNTELAKKPKECLEYIVVHEMAHLLEPTHNARFVNLMDGLMPSWKLRRDQLNRLPVRHEEWRY